jgi:hypothetical protein
LVLSGASPARCRAVADVDAQVAQQRFDQAWKDADVTLSAASAF